MIIFVADLINLGEDKTISVRDILTNIICLLSLIKKNGKVIIASSLIFSGIGFSLFNEGPYIAPTEIFLIKDSHKINDFVLSDSYGFKYTDIKVNKDEFSSLVTSSKIINSILEKVITISGKKDTVYNHIISCQVPNLEHEYLSGLSKRNIALKCLRENIRTIINNKSTITLEILSHNEELAIKVSKLLVDKTKDLIKNIGLKTEIKFRKKLVEKIDSLTKKVSLIDTNLIRQLNLQFEVSDLKIARFESNIEVISLPDYPLDKKGIPVMAHVILFSFIGFFLSLLFVLIKKYISNNL